MKTENKSIISICPQQKKKKKSGFFYPVGSTSSPEQIFSTQLQKIQEKWWYQSLWEGYQGMKTSSRTLFYFTILGNSIYSNVLRAFHEIYHVCLRWGTLWFKCKIQNVLFTSLFCQESHPLMTLALPPLRDTPELSLSYICHPHFPCHYRSYYPNLHDWISSWNSKNRACYSTGLKSVLLWLWKTPCTLSVVYTSVVCTWSYTVLPTTPFNLEQESKALSTPHSFIK